MIRDIVKRILPNLTALNFAELVAGVVTPVSKKVFDENNNPVVKIFPAYENTPAACRSGDYLILVPDEKYRSIIYFEEISNTIDSETNHELKVTSDVRLVAWFNLKKISASVTSDTLMRLILQALPTTIAEFNDMYNIRVSLTGIENRSPQIFSSYVYDEAETQYLLFPYEYGSLRLSVSYSMNKCVDDITISPNCGKK